VDADAVEQVALLGRAINEWFAGKEIERGLRKILRRESAQVLGITSMIRSVPREGKGYPYAFTVLPNTVFSVGHFDNGRTRQGHQEIAIELVFFFVVRSESASQSSPIPQFLDLLLQLLLDLFELPDFGGAIFFACCDRQAIKPFVDA